MLRNPATSSGQLAVGTTAVCAAPASLQSIILSPAAAASTVTVYDNASAASGTILAVLTCPASVASVICNFTVPVYCKLGITAVVAGTGATAYITFYKET